MIINITFCYSPNDYRETLGRKVCKFTFHAVINVSSNEPCRRFHLSRYDNLVYTVVLLFRCGRSIGRQAIRQLKLLLLLLLLIKVDDGVGATTMKKYLCIMKKFVYYSMWRDERDDFSEQLPEVDSSLTFAQYLNDLLCLILIN